MRFKKNLLPSLIGMITGYILCVCFLIFLASLLGSFVLNELWTPLESIEAKIVILWIATSGAIFGYSWKDYLEFEE